MGAAVDDHTEVGRSAMLARVRLWLAIGAFVGALAGMVVATPVAGATPKGTALVMPVQSKVHGRSYGEWSAEWWQWAFSMPADHNPLTDTADCSASQSSDHVWFLGGSFAAVPQGGQVVAIATRTCSVPTGTFLFIPIINAEASTLEGNGTTAAALLAFAQSLQDEARNMSITIDGVAVPDVADYRVKSVFTYGPLPANNLLGQPAGSTSLAAGDGVYVMVKPLNVGEHTIHFHGEAPAFGFLLDITYNITVSPGSH